MTQMNADGNEASVRTGNNGRRAEPTASGPFPSVFICVICGQEVRCLVSLTMIVKDEEENLPKCLIVRGGLFDEIVVVDTGSKDRTREIAREFGARVFDFVWVDDFAAARNAALARATGDYAFWLDADDVIDPPQREKLERLLDTFAARRRRPAYVVKCSCDPGPNGDGGQTVVDHIRLFPLREDVRWTYRVHEQILPALRRANVPVTMDRHHGPAHRVHRSGAARAEAPARWQDPRGRAGRAAGRSVRALQPGLDRRRAAGLARRPGLSPAQPVRLGADRFDHAEALRPDRPLPPDARRSSRRLGGLRRGLVVRPRRRRAALPQGRGAPQGGPAGRGRDDAGGGS